MKELEDPSVQPQVFKFSNNMYKIHEKWAALKSQSGDFFF